MPLFPDPKTPDEFLALLPPGLRAFIDREFAAGNAIAETGTGFPSPPVGVWIKLQKGFLTLKTPLPDGVVHRDRPHWTWPAECTDPARHFFVLAGAHPAPQGAYPTTKPRFRPSKPEFTGHKTAFRPPPAFSGKDMVDQYSEDRRVGDAIAAHLGLMWDKKTEAALLAAVGQDGLARAKEIDAFANRAEIWTTARTHDEAYQRTQRDLADKFPFLSPAAIQRLSTRAAWGWR
jgi:hypothetical protein